MLSTRRSQLWEKRQATVVNSWQFKGSEALGGQCGGREQKAWAHQQFFLCYNYARARIVLQKSLLFVAYYTKSDAFHLLYFYFFKNSFQELSRPLSILCWHHCGYPIQPYNTSLLVSPKIRQSP